MITKFVLSLLFFFSCPSAFAQGFAADTTHQFRLSILLGGGSIASYDNFGSPLPYSGTTAPIGMEIEYITPNVRHLLSGIGITSLGNAANLTNIYSTGENDERKAYFAFADLRYRFTHYLTDISSSGIHFSIGGEWENMIFTRAYDYSGDLGSASGSGEGSSSIAAVGDLTYSIGDHRFGASLSLPLIALVWRPAYGFINGNTSLFSYPLEDRFEPIGTMWSWRVGLDYDYAISGPFLLGIHFHELYYQYPVLAWRAVGSENDLALDVTWRFNL